MTIFIRATRRFSSKTRFLPPYREKNEFDFFVEHDWLLPMGYVGFHFSASLTVSVANGGKKK